MCARGKPEKEISVQCSGSVSPMTSCNGAKLEQFPVDRKNETGGMITMDVLEIGPKNVYCDVTSDGGSWTVS